MIWSLRKHRLKPRMSPNAINLRTLELETAKEILGELFDANTNEVDDMIRQRMDPKLLLWSGVQLVNSPQYFQD